MEIEPGRVLGDFRILRKLGEGGMGTVYAACQQSLEREVALKVLPFGLGMSAPAVRRFRREARAAGRLHHVNIVSVYAEGEAGGLVYYAMELVRGPSLDQFIGRLSRSPPAGESDSRLGAAGDTEAETETATEWTPPLVRNLPPAQEPSGRVPGLRTSDPCFHDGVARIIQEVAEALEYAHRVGIIHRDVKPSNIMLDEGGRPKLMDFGVARLQEEPGLTISGQFLGTPRYMSPEQMAAGRARIDHRTDIYSLGITLYELLTQELAFDGPNREQIVSQVLTRDLRRPRLINPRLPVDLETICLKACQKDPAARYATAGAMAADLRRYLEHGTIAARRVGPLGRLWRTVRRRKLPAALTALTIVLAGACVGLGWQALRGHQQQHRLLAEREFSEAELLYSRGQYRDALATVESSLALRPRDVASRLLRARILIEIERAEEARRELEDVLRAYPDEGAAHYLMALVIGRSRPAEAARHQARAEQGPLASANAYHLRGVAAESPSLRLDFLSRAVEVDPGHYPAMKGLALAHFEVGDFESMVRDAERAVALRPQDPMAWRLLGLARREAGQWVEARKAYDRSLELAPDLPVTLEERRETFERLGDYRSALADARTGAAREPGNLIRRFEVFLALLRSGDPEGAREYFVQTRRDHPGASQAFEHQLTLATLDGWVAGRPLDIPANLQAIPPFRAVREATEQFRSLSSRGRRLVPGGFSTSWSPDGTQVAFGRIDRSRLILGGGFTTPRDQQASGIAVLDRTTGRSRTLVRSGKDPAWSPDGRHIAFVREPSPDAYLDEEIWLVTADGGGSRWLAKGGYPSWSADSRFVYFHSRHHNALCRVEADASSRAARRMLDCPGWYPRLSSDERYVAYVHQGEVQVAELASGRVLCTWRPPSPGPALVSWSADGKYLAVGPGNDSPLGLWILEGSPDWSRIVDAWKALRGPATLGVWSPNGRIFSWDVRGLYWDIWVADLDPLLPLRESLAPIQSLEEHRIEADPISRYTRALAIDPEDVSAYRLRAAAFLEQGRWNESAADLGKALELGGPDPQLLQWRGSTRLGLGQTADAFADYEAAGRFLLAQPELVPDDLLDVGWTLVSLPSGARTSSVAVAVADRILATHRDDPLARLLRGAALFRKDRFEDALSILQSAASPGAPAPTGEATRLEFIPIRDFCASLCLSRLGRTAEAQRLYRRGVTVWRSAGRSPGLEYGRHQARLEAAGELGFLRIAARDDFDSSARLAWEIRRPAPDHVSRDKVPGCLSLTTQRGALAGSHQDAQNLFLFRNPLDPSADFMVTTCLVSFDPTVPWQQAGLLCYDDDDHYAKAVMIRGINVGLELLIEKDGRVTQSSQGPVPLARRFWIRILRHRLLLTAAFSVDGEHYVPIACLSWGGTGPRWFGLIAKNGPVDAPETEAAFDFFEIVAFP